MGGGWGWLNDHSMSRPLLSGRLTVSDHLNEDFIVLSPRKEEAALHLYAIDND